MAPNDFLENVPETASKNIYCEISIGGNFPRPSSDMTMTLPSAQFLRFLVVHAILGFFKSLTDFLQQTPSFRFSKWMNSYTTVVTVVFN